MPISIGGVILSNPILLAPMSGVSDLPFRRLVKRAGAGLVVSEMIASQAMIRESRQSLKMAETAAEEAPMAVQLAGCEPRVMAEAARLNADRGAALIDINMGCPVKKVVNGYAGSALMRDLDHAARIVEATVKAVSLPVTLKMRTGWDEKNRNAPELARRAEGLGVKMITVHGRTRNQLFNGRADWRFVAEVKRAVRIPVVVNGDINEVDDVKKALAQSGADGVMVGRGTYGRPWLLRQMSYYLETGVHLPAPPLAEQFAVISEHYDMILAHYGTASGVRIARKHLGWYTRGLPGSAEFRNRLMRMDEAHEVRSALAEFYQPLLERQAA
jgi:tRNA-dihydrouridine synthase B